MSARFNLLFAVSAILTQVLLISLRVDARLIPSGGLSWLLSSMGDILRWLIVSAGLFLLLIFYAGRVQKQTQYILRIKSFSVLRTTIHLICFAIFYYLTLAVFGKNADSSLLLSLSWLLSGLLVFFSWINLILSRGNLIRFCSEYASRLLIASLFSFIILLLTFSVGRLWEPLSLVTLQGAEWLLLLFFESVEVSISNKLLGANGFNVKIAPQCSGLEGLVIAVIITLIHLYMLKGELKFPLAFVLTPVAAGLAILFNIIRVAALISIGALYSPEMAVGGFHSVAGWLTAVIIAFLIIFVFSNLRIFYRDNAPSKAGRDFTANATEIRDHRLAWAIMVPFVLFLTVTLVSHIFSLGFDYLYPLKVIIAAGVIGYFWKVYQWQPPARRLEPIAGGLAVAVLWVLLVSPDGAYDRLFIKSVTGLPLWAMIAWVFFRALGFWLIAPILEELVFRGYIMARLSRQPLENENHLKFAWLPLVGSSLLFGYIHASFLAGVLAGIIFAGVRYRGKSLSEPILSHISANVFVALWAVYTGRWVLI